jgi:hypothetical protein
MSFLAEAFSLAENEQEFGRNIDDLQDLYRRMLVEDLIPFY